MKLSTPHVFAANHSYSQWVGREKLFERERKDEPTVQFWDGCTMACDSVEVQYA
jgi:hypothetical protein